MSLKKILIGLGSALAIGVAAHTAQAATICTGCEYVEGAQGTYLGAHNAATNDLSTFQNSPPPRLGNTAFTNNFVFDIVPFALSSASADFTSLASVANFRGSLYRAGVGTVCAGAAGTGCASVVLGDFVGSDSAGADRDWEIVAVLAPGRYVLVIQGDAVQDNSAYTGQLAFARFVPEPSVVLLLGAGLLAVGFGVRRRA